MQALRARARAVLVRRSEREAVHVPASSTWRTIFSDQLAVSNMQTVAGLDDQSYCRSRGGTVLPVATAPRLEEAAKHVSGTCTDSYSNGFNGACGALETIFSH